jgi:hypothetical protein
MTKSIEERLETLEREVDCLKSKPTANGTKSGSDWISAIVGSFADDPEFDEIVRLGKELRDADRPKDE